VPLAQLLADVRERPGDREHRQVLADALLDVGDPRGELMIAQLAGQPPTPAQLERCVARVREAAPGVAQIRFEGGLVTDLLVELDGVPGIDRSWLADEPLVRVVTSLPSKDAEIALALERCAEVLSACHGLVATSQINAAHWAVLAPLVDACGLELVELTLGDVEGFAADGGWSALKVAHLISNAPGALGRVLDGLAGLRMLRLDGANLALVVPQVLELAALEHLDLRGVGLGDGELAGIRAWLEDAPGRSVRHERVDLRPPSEAGLEDPFGARGLTWDGAPPLRCRVTPVPGRRPGFATARGAELQFHRRDRPAWRRTLDAPATALAAVDDTVLVGHADGRVDGHGRADRIEAHDRLPGAVRSLHALGSDLAAIYAGGWQIRRGREIRRGTDELAALVLTERGDARAHGTRVTVGGPSPREVELGEPVLALATVGDRIVALAGRQVWRLDEDGPVSLGACTRTGRPAVACRGELVAWTGGRQLGRLSRGGAQTSVAYPRTYSGGEEREFALADLCVLDDETVVTALEHGGANLLVPGAAMKADEFSGEPKRRWVFVYEGQILIAG
jgi:hypothetical protein